MTGPEPKGRVPGLLVDALYSYASDGENRRTEVFGCALAASPEFSRQVALRVGAPGDARGFTVEVQAGVPGHANLYDLVLRGVDTAGVPVWVLLEAKFN